MRNVLQFRRAVLGTLGVLLAAGAAATSHAEPTGSVVSVTSDLAEMGMDPMLNLTGNVKIFTDEIHLNGIMQAPDGKLIPGAAAKWEVSPDLHSWIWTIREGVKFHDGSTMTAEDFAFSWKRAVLSDEFGKHLQGGVRPPDRGHLCRGQHGHRQDQGPRAAHAPVVADLRQPGRLRALQGPVGEGGQRRLPHPSHRRGAVQAQGAEYRLALRRSGSVGRALLLRADGQERPGHGGSRAVDPASLS